ncbi:hypothetical protein Pelo_9634 [Pelomyxa schiedti]|nr:hypothetical protein Pelo_9634 [Pelomyxa schiedti]
MLVRGRVVEVTNKLKGDSTSYNDQLVSKIRQLHVGRQDLDPARRTATATTSRERRVCTCGRSYGGDLCGQTSKSSADAARGALLLLTHRDLTTNNFGIGNGNGGDDDDDALMATYESGNSKGRPSPFLPEMHNKSKPQRASKPLFRLADGRSFERHCKYFQDDKQFRQCQATQTSRTDCTEVPKKPTSSQSHPFWTNS